MKNNLAKFCFDKDKCIACGKCIKVCPGQLLKFNENKDVIIKDIDCFGWDGCWKCQHCMAVCPKSAISVLGKSPEECVTPPESENLPQILDALIKNRRSHRQYLNKDVDKRVLDDILKTVQNAPNGGNKGLVEYTVIDDKEQVKYFHDIVYSKMEKLANKGIYANGYDKKSYEQLKEWEKIVRPDMLFCSAPNLCIPHAPVGEGCYIQDVNIACVYFDLLCSSRGLGSIMMTYPLDVLDLMPKEKSMLGIPDNHYIAMIIGFGYPKIKYKRGVDKFNENKIKKIKFKI
ncbi:nitroreductase family protein [Anaerofustis stercorihominis]|uniref:nitroreductase family protein n=1 Tax=Anaerofustis stercorihominis TaxID=214853 RepID=UPI001106F325|nr:nitroreductase family protein [Anaerofustis stercorihominis]